MLFFFRGRRLPKIVRVVFAGLAIGLLIVVVLIIPPISSSLSTKGRVSIMSTQTAHIEAPLTPQQALLADHIGNEVYSSHYAERKLSRFVIGVGTTLLIGSMGLIFSLAHRPVTNRYIRIDEMGRAQAIAYSDLNYSPREGEVRTYLTDWANYRYTISRDTIAKKYPLNYYFLSQTLASQLMTEDNANHLVSQVVGGQIEQSDVEVKNVTITSMSEETVQGARIARGTALIALDKLYSPRNSREPRTEHWVMTRDLLPESRSRSAIRRRSSRSSRRSIPWV